ncbi:hypothetical protein L0337_23255 [candidate division KSB1 bacterium]|nr:hypothetical protein [candidate division KSB1 bacterium]
MAAGLQMGIEQLDAITAAIMDRNIFGRAQRRYLINGVRKIDDHKATSPQDAKFSGKFSRFGMTIIAPCSATCPEAARKFRGTVREAKKLDFFDAKCYFINLSKN